MPQRPSSPEWPRSKRDVTTDALNDVLACGPIATKLMRQFGEGVAMTRANIEEADRRGFPVLWLGSRMFDAAQRQRFVVYTLELRAPYVESVLGREPPAAAIARADLAAELKARMGEADGAANLGAIVMANLLRDEALQDPGPEDCFKASTAVLRVAAYAGEDQSITRKQMIEYGMEMLGGFD